MDSFAHSSVNCFLLLS